MNNNHNHRKPRSSWFTDVRVVGLLLLVGSVILVFLRYGTDWTRIGQEFFANLISETMGLVFTVLVIDALNERRAIRSEKRTLILQMGSQDRAFAAEAARMLRAQGWLLDGSLHKANLHGAQLSETKLFNADMKGTILREADLSRANLDRADLRGAFLGKSNLEGATLRETNLEGATLVEANLKHADLFRARLAGAYLSKADLTSANVMEEQLRQTASLNGAILPDGTSYDGRFHLPEDRAQ